MEANRPALVLFSAPDLSDEEEADLRSKLDALVDGVRFRRLPFPDVWAKVVRRPEDDGVLFVWSDNLDAEDVQELTDALDEACPDWPLVVGNFEPDAVTLTAEELSSFILTLQSELDRDTATTAERDALEVLRACAHRLAKLLRAGMTVGEHAPFAEDVVVRVVVEDSDPSGYGSAWLVLFKVGDEVVQTFAGPTLEQSAEMAESLVSAYERMVASAG